MYLYVYKINIHFIGIKTDYFLYLYHTQYMRVGARLLLREGKEERGESEKERERERAAAAHFTFTMWPNCTTENEFPGERAQGKISCWVIFISPQNIRNFMLIDVCVCVFRGNSALGQVSTKQKFSAATFPYANFCFVLMLNLKVSALLNRVQFLSNIL